MNLENQESEIEFETKFLIELIEMCSKNGFSREAETLTKILFKLNGWRLNTKYFH